MTKRAQEHWTYLQALAWIATRSEGAVSFVGAPGITKRDLKIWSPEFEELLETAREEALAIKLKYQDLPALSDKAPSNPSRDLDRKQDQPRRRKSTLPLLDLDTSERTLLSYLRSGELVGSGFRATKSSEPVPSIDWTQHPPVHTDENQNYITDSSLGGWSALRFDARMVRSLFGVTAARRATQAEANALFQELDTEFFQTNGHHIRSIDRDDLLKVEGAKRGLHIIQAQCRVAAKTGPRNELGTTLASKRAQKGER